MLTGHSCTKFHIRCLLVTGIEPKSKGSLRSVAFLLFYSLQKYNKNTYVPKAYYHTSFRELKEASLVFVPPLKFAYLPRFY